MSNRPRKHLHFKDAIAMLETKLPVDLKVWKLKDASIIEYKGVICVGSHWRGGTHTIRLPQSNLLREFRDITLFEINGYEVDR